MLANLPAWRGVLRLALLVAMAGGCGAAIAQTGIAGRGAGLGLKPGSGEIGDPHWELLAARARRPDQPLEYSLYGGERAAALLGMQARESYAGVLYPLRAGFGTSLEAGYVQEAPLSPRRYALSGQVHAAFDSGQGVSLGLKYVAPRPESVARYDAPGDFGAPGGYGLAPLYRAAPWASASYQLHMSYQYSPGGTVGVAVGRDLEGRAPFQDGASAALRQFSLTGSHWLSPSWALSYDLLSDDMASPWKVQGLRLGVRYRW